MEWISVDDELPKKSGDYDVQYSRYFNDTGRYNHSFFPWLRYWHDEKYSDRIVTHWMPLPEPPEE